MRPELLYTSALSYGVKLKPLWRFKSQVSPPIELEASILIVETVSLQQKFGVLGPEKGLSDEN